MQSKNGNEILTLKDAQGDVITLTFENFNATLVVTQSGGKTFIYDPPATDSKGITSPATSGLGDHASSFLSAASTNSDQGLSHDSDQNGLMTKTSAFGNDHMAPALAQSPTVASATFGILGNDSFAFHPNLGSDSAQNTDVPTNELAHASVQVGGPAFGSTALEFHAEFALDVIHQDDTHLAATVDQFHQVAANSTLLH